MVETMAQRFRDREAADMQAAATKAEKDLQCMNAIIKQMSADVDHLDGTDAIEGYLSSPIELHYEWHCAAEGAIYDPRHPLFRASQDLELQLKERGFSTSWSLYRAFSFSKSILQCR